MILDHSNPKCYSDRKILVMSFSLLNFIEAYREYLSFLFEWNILVINRAIQLNNSLEPYLVLVMYDNLKFNTKFITLSNIILSWMISEFIYINTLDCIDNLNCGMKKDLSESIFYLLTSI